MEIKINKEILTYQETIFFGLTLRQFVCSLMAVLIAVGFYLLLSPVFGKESVSWICILGAAPFAVAGFFQYNGMKLEKFAWVWFKSCFLLAAPRVWRSELYFNTNSAAKEADQT